MNSHHTPIDPHGAAQGPRPSETEPRLPHERDESADSQGNAAPANAPTGRQAHDDVERGLVDTDRAPLLDTVYNDKVKPPQRR